MKEIGKQYYKDDLKDKTGFKKKARLHQSKYRAEVLDVEYEEYGNRLTEKDGKIGVNFYKNFFIFEEVKKRFPGFKKGLYCDMLRSEHIPFNFFIPFNQNITYCKNVFNDIIKESIDSIDKIVIEYAPVPKTKYLNDNTSFDAYIEYTHIDGKKGIIGIEVKYTEHEYILKSGSKEALFVNDKSSSYYKATELSDLYKPESITELNKDRYRQIWRNQLLGESILQKDKDKYSYFTLMIFFPAENTHFMDVSEEYTRFLKNNVNKFNYITYENYFSLLQKHCPDEKYQKWINYLNERYIV